MFILRALMSLVPVASAPGFGACGSHTTPPVLTPSGESLPSWNYSAAASVVRSPASSACVTEPIEGSLVGLQLLAWRVIELHDGQRDEALWWGYFLTGAGPEWLLAMTFRDQRGSTPGTWRFARREPWGAACGRTMYRRAPAQPTNADVVDFFHSTGAAAVTRLPDGVDPGDWFHPTLMPGSRWAIRSAVVRTAAWQLAMGSPPPSEFQP